MVVISCYNLEQGKEEDRARLSLSEAIYVWGRETAKHVSYFVSLSRTVSCLISKKITGRGSAVPMTGLNQSDSSSRARERVWIFLEIREISLISLIYIILFFVINYKWNIKFLLE